MKAKAAKAWTAMLATAAMLTLACGGPAPAAPTQPPTATDDANSDASAPADPGPAAHAHAFAYFVARPDPATDARTRSPSYLRPQPHGAVRHNERVGDSILRPSDQVPNFARRDISRRRRKRGYRLFLAGG